jgi:hypothetical protein
MGGMGGMGGTGGMGGMGGTGGTGGTGGRGGRGGTTFHSLVYFPRLLPQKGVSINVHRLSIGKYLRWHDFCID